DKVAILLMCMMSLTMSDSFMEPVILVLVGVTASAAAQLLTGRIAASVIIAACSLLCGVFPLFFCMMPLMLYDALWEKKWWLVLPAAVVLVNIGDMKILQIAMTLIALAVTIIIFLRVSGLEQTVTKLTLLRDEIAGKNRQLGEQNLRLAQAQDNEIHLATLKERNRIAREIHDNVGHMLTRSLLQAGALLVINKDDELREPLESLKSTLDSAMTSIRESVHDLHDDSIDLKKVIEESISTVDSRFTVTLDCDVSEYMAGNVKLCMIGVVKEGLSNAVKHSTGDRISIIVREHPGFYQLMLEDNGSCSEIKESGIGLKNMRDRVEALKGRISLTPSQEGFKIFVSIPK
ncbi:MAG: sensor histidine kinase, partial [Ruminococcus sp.]|nr:sensor histidine kinase [Ruminococcus sp.]